jgi:hypothetical protein
MNRNSHLTNNNALNEFFENEEKFSKKPSFDNILSKNETPLKYEPKARKAQNLSHVSEGSSDDEVGSVKSGKSIKGMHSYLG